MRTHPIQSVFGRSTVLLLLSCLLCFNSAAQGPTPTPTGTTTGTPSVTASPTVTPKPAPQGDTVKKVTVKKAHTTGVANFFSITNCDPKEKPSDTSDTVYPEEYLIVYTDSAGIDYAINKNDSVRLWINGVCFSNIKPLFVNRITSSVVFRLDVDTARTSPWKLFYAWPNYWKFSRIAIFSLGSLKEEFRGSECPRLTLCTSSPWMLWLGYGLMILLLFLLYRFGRGIGKDTGLYAQNGVRIAFDNTKTNAESAVINIKDIPYSLARFQFLFWLLIIFFSIIHIWTITDALATPTGTVLILLGISGGTFYVGKLIDTKKETEEDPATDPANAGKTPEQIAEEQKRETERKAKEHVEAFIKKRSRTKSWIYDLLNDGDSISLHRLQLLIFTFFLGIYFIWQVLYCLRLPQFSETMMTLMGISSGLYAGVKTSEK